MSDIFERWDGVASIRNQKRCIVHRNHTEEQIFFPPDFQPLFFHPRVRNLQKNELNYILTQSSYAFLRRIIAHETGSVCRVVASIIDDQFSLKYPQDLKQELRTVIIDEMYHSHVAEDFIHQVQTLTGIRPIEFYSQCPLSLAISAAMKHLENHPKELREAFLTLAVCMAENSLTESLSQMSKDPRVHPAFTKLNLDHLKDEGRHGKIFCRVLSHLWSQLEPPARNLILGQVDPFIKVYVDHESRRYDDALILKSLDYSEQDINSIVNDSHPPRNEDELDCHPTAKQIKKFMASQLAPFWQVQPSLSVPKKGLSLPDLLLQVASSLGRKIAIEAPKGSLSYDDLNRLSDQVAYHLFQLDIPKSTVIAVSGDVGHHFPVIFFGVLKAGLIFFPLPWHEKTTQQKETLDYFGVNWLISGDYQPDEKINLLNPQILMNSTNVVKAIPACKPLPGDAACLLTTSGTTGRPKGVLLQHHGLVQFGLSCGEAFPVRRSSRWLRFAPWGTDASLADLINTISAGATLCMGDTSCTTSVDGFLRVWKAEKITILNLPTSFFSQIVQEIKSRSFDIPRETKTVLIYGESLPQEILNSWIDCAPGHIGLVNTYGPTEASIGVSFFHLNRHYRLARDQQIIGQPLAGARFYILDQNQNPVSEGEVGELYIAGDCLSPGYYGPCSERDQNRFMTIKLENREEKTFRTGDRVRWLKTEDGQVLNFLGRMDRQIKIAGYRFNSDDIETEVNKYPGILGSRVLLSEQDVNSRLLCFFVSKNKGISSPDLKDFLRKSLPSKGVPSIFLSLKSFPLKQRGKIDDSKLLEYYYKRKTSGFRRDYWMSDLWASLLGELNIDGNHNFFRLGGHSLLAIQLIARVNHHYKIQCTIRNLVTNPCYRDFLNLVEEKTKERHKNLPVSEKSATLCSEGNSYPLVYAQQVVWRSHYCKSGKRPDLNVSWALDLKGPLSTSLLNQTINQVLEAHDSLSSVVQKSGEKLHQVRQVSTIKISEVNGSQKELQQYIDHEIIKPFNLNSKLVPLRISWLHNEETGENTILFCHHQILHDGLSIHSLVRDIGDLLVANYERSHSRPPAIGSSQISYAQKLRYSNQGFRQDDLSYWAEQLKGAKPLKYTFCRPEGFFDPCSGSMLQKNLGGNPLNAFIKLCHDAQMSVFSGLLSAILWEINRETNQTDLLVPTIVSTRDSKEDLDIVGLLVNTVFLRSQIAPTDTLIQFGRKVQESLVGALEHRWTPLAAAANAASLKLSKSKPLFQFAVNYHQFGPKFGTFDEGCFSGKSRFIPNGCSRLPLTVEIFHYESDVEFQYIYSPDLYEKNRIHALAQRVQNLLIS